MYFALMASFQQIFKFLPILSSQWYYIFSETVNFVSNFSLFQQICQETVYFILRTLKLFDWWTFEQLN